MREGRLGILWWVMGTPPDRVSAQRRKIKIEALFRRFDGILSQSNIKYQLTEKPRLKTKYTQTLRT